MFSPTNKENLYEYATAIKMLRISTKTQQCAYYSKYKVESPKESIQNWNEYLQQM